MKRKINTTQVLTPEDKKYLRKVSNYLNSLGMRDGSLEIDVDSPWDFDFREDIDWNHVTHFTNNYSAEIPSGLTPILQKIAHYIEDNSLFNPDDNSEEEMNWSRFDFDIDTKKQEISFNYWWSFYARGEGNSIEWDGEQGKDIFEEWEKDGVLDELRVTPNDGILTVKYNGSGDSGYIESSFEENGDGLPTSIEDWCYRQLENNFGGWEINEGSDGEFIFNFNEMTIELNHTYNVEENAHDTIYEESFAE
jgi:hypothetical protein